MKSPGFAPQERASFNKIVKSGFVDTFREFNDEPHQYSWWSYRTRAREINVGWRIDYICASERAMEDVEGAAILAHVMGSDHCPVSIEISNFR